ncbi:MAG: mannosyltransferase family protein [Thermoleophilaceae bacterium]
MAQQATPTAGRQRVAARLVSGVRASDALRSAAVSFLLTRTAVLCVAIFAAVSMSPGREGGIGAHNAARYDVPALTHPLGGVGDELLSPLARWDAVWFLGIADHGYGHAAAGRAAFFPLYPLAVRAVAELGGGSRGDLLVAAYLVSLAAFAAALYLLHRLVALELGRPAARTTLVLLAVFPASLYFGAPYSESLFLLASVGGFYAARTGRWAWAGVAAAAAAGTRSAGVLLLLPLAAIYVRERGWRPGRDAAWLLLGPLGLGAFALYLGFAHGDALAFLDVQHAWYRHFAGPLGGVWDGLVAGVEGARQLLSGSREPVYFREAGGDPFRVAGMNLMLLGFLVFALVGSWGVWRRLPLPYALWTAVALLLPLSFPVGPQPLMSLPRFLSVLFPLFMWLALECEERRWTQWVAPAFAVGLGVFTEQFATWHWLA